jgi:hypothetical protein
MYTKPKSKIHEITKEAWSLSSAVAGLQQLPSADLK